MPQSRFSSHITAGPDSSGLPFLPSSRSRFYTPSPSPPKTTRFWEASPGKSEARVWQERQKPFKQLILARRRNEGDAFARSEKRATRQSLFSEALALPPHIPIPQPGKQSLSFEAQIPHRRHHCEAGGTIPIAIGTAIYVLRNERTYRKQRTSETGVFARQEAQLPKQSLSSGAQVPTTLFNLFPKRSCL